MDFPSQYPDSPAKPLVGPARARLAARQNRTSSLKPYSRRPSAAASAAQSGLISASSSSNELISAGQPQTPSHGLAVPASDAKSPFSSLRGASPLALLGSVTKAISRPLSWLASSSQAAKSDLEGSGLLTQSASTGSLASLARKRAAYEASAKALADDPEREAPSLAARAVGARLAAGVLGSPAPRHDIESRGDESQSAKQPELPLRRSARTVARGALSPPPAASSSRLSARPAVQSPMTRSRTSRKVLELNQGGAEDSQMELLQSRSPSPAASAVSAKGRQRLSIGQSPLAASNSQLGNYATVGYRRGSSLRPDDSIDARLSPSQSSPSFAFGYGSERRLARSSFGLPPTTSPFQLPSRSPLALRAGRSSLGPSFGSEAGLSPQPFRGGSLGPGSIPGGGTYRASSPTMRGTTPKRRDWGSLGLAASRSPGLGDDMMRDYIATRTLPGTAPRSLSMNVFSDPNSSRAGSVVADETMSLTPSKLGKRDIDMSIDGDDDRSITASARKRQMVWHPQLGFISQEELRAREPKPPSPKNEAERLLSVLESMRSTAKPARDSSAAASSATPRMLQPISVPAPVADRSLAPASSKLPERLQSVGVAPYSRALRKSKLALSQQGADERLSLRAKLRRSRPATTSVNVELEDKEDESANAMHEAETETEEEEEPTPPPKRAAKPPVRRSRRLQAKDVDEDSGDEVVAEETLATAPTPKAKIANKPVIEVAPAKKVEVSNAEAAPAAPKPTSSRISLAAAKPAPAIKKDNFSVRNQGDSDGPREKSSLRQGATKKFRSHQSSGRISAWEEDLDDDEDLPDANELAKIKLPTNMFPTGFSFGGGSNAELTGATSEKPVSATTAEPTKPEAAPAAPTFSFGAPAAKKAQKGEDTSKASDASLLGRLGGFSAPATDMSKPAESSTPSKSVSSSYFSFTAPAKQTPKPSFTFGAPAANGAKDAAAFSDGGKPAPPSFNFFSTPAAPSKPVDDEKKSGPVPNFFGSALAKTDAKPASTEPAKFVAAPASTGASFSFDKPSPTPAFAGFGQTATAPDKKDEPAKPSSSDGLTFGTADKNADENKPATTAPSFSFGQPAASASAAATFAPKPFTFGAPAGKRSVEGEESKSDAEPVAKKTAAPTFSFSASAAGGASSNSAGAAPPTFGGFGKPATAPSSMNDKAAETSGKVPNFFGAAGSASGDATSANENKLTSPVPASPAPANGTTTPSFSFGKPAAPSSESKPVTTTPTAQPSKPAFSFGAPAANSNTPATPGASKPPTFTFGAPASSSAATPAASTLAATAAPTFGGFGAPASTSFGNSEMMEDSPSNASSAAAPASQPKFTFGSPAPASSNIAAANSGAISMTFGAPSSGATGSSATASKPMTFSFGSPAGGAAGSSAPSTPKFGAAALPSSSTGMFGSPAPAPVTPSATSVPSTAFTFGSPAPTTSQPASMFGGSSAPTTFGSGQPSAAPFTFGAPQQSQQAPAPSSPFTFGTPNSNPQPQPAFTFGSAANTPSQQPQQQPSANGGIFTFGAGQPGPGTPSAAPSPAPFTFGGPASQPPTPGGASSPFAFNAAAGPAQPVFGTPQQQDPTATPPGSAGGLFNMGAAPAAQGSGGRAIKPLRQRRPR